MSYLHIQFFSHWISMSDEFCKSKLGFLEIIIVQKQLMDPATENKLSHNEVEIMPCIVSGQSIRVPTLPDCPRVRYFFYLVVSTKLKM